MRNAPTTVFALPEEQKENLRKTIANLDEAASFLFPAYTCATACRAMLEIDKPESDSRIGSIWGRDIGSNSYIQSKCSPIYQSILADSFSNIRLTIISDLANIAQQIAADIDYGLDANYYMKEENGAAIQGAIDELERCNCMALSSHRSKAGRLCWYQDVPKDQVMALQKALNKIPEFGTLTEDGVYGEKTSNIWNSFLDVLARGAVPTLGFIDPLQTDITKITIGATRAGEQSGLKNALVLDGKLRYVRIDPSHNGKSGMFRGQKTQIDYPHINLEGLKDSNALYNWLQVNYNHYPLSEEAYNVLKNLEKTGEVVRVAGRVLLVAGIILDALEIGTTMYSDLNDADGRLGKKTISTVASIGGSWGGSIVGANVGGGYWCARWTGCANSGPGPRHSRRNWRGHWGRGICRMGRRYYLFGGVKYVVV